VTLHYPLAAGAPGKPAAEFDRLRREEPVARVVLPTGDDGWLITRYDDNRTVLADARFSRAAAAGRTAPRARPVPVESGTLPTTDPPEHTRLRTPVTRAFSTGRVAALRTGIERRTRACLDGLTSPADLVSGLAQPLALGTIGDLLGVAPADHAWFRGCAQAVLDVTGRPPEEVAAAAGELEAYVAGLIHERRAAPGDDLLSALLGDGTLCDAEVAALARTLLLAGYSPTANLLAGALFAVLAEGGYRELQACPELVPGAVEELLRYVPMAASGGAIRIATDDIRIGAVLIRRGEAVLPALVSANRDPAHFDHPDDLRLDRTTNRHLAFGHGPHRCPAAPLVRELLAVVLTAVPARFPSLALAVPADDVEWAASGMQRGPRHLPVTW
jgi:cytochrome P450